MSARPERLAHPVPITSSVLVAYRGADGQMYLRRDEHVERRWALAWVHRYRQRFDTYAMQARWG